MMKWVRETSQKKKIEKLNEEYNLFKNQISNEMARIKLGSYRDSRVFQAGTTPKSIQTEQKPIEDINLLKGKCLNFHGNFVFDKLGYDENKLYRAGSVKIK